MERYLKKYILKDLKKKMVFISGPRQVGKTTLAQNLAPSDHRYLNWDVPKDREFILEQRFPKEDFIVFDEIHTFHGWRNYIKGFYDKNRGRKKVLLTGSAMLDYYRHSGDSLQGRYHHYRLHPLSAKELGLTATSELKKLMNLGGFPEPFFSASGPEAQRWRREYRTRVVNEDIASLEMSWYLSKMELLLLRLPKLVGSPLSINGLREDLELSHKVVAKYVDIFERLYLIYRISPFHSNLLRSVKKEKKHYHYNWAEVKDEGAKFENLVAGHLLKWVHFQQDYRGQEVNLHYFRDNDAREIDFIITLDNEPIRAIECKLKAKDISPHLKYFKNKFPKAECIQVHLEKTKEYQSKEGIYSFMWPTLLNSLI